MSRAIARATFEAVAFRVIAGEAHPFFTTIMVRDGAFTQAYNVQIAVDEANQIMVAEAVGNQAPEVEYFAPMLRRVVRNCGQVPERATADAGYFYDDNIRAAEPQPDGGAPARAQVLPPT